MVPRHPEHLPEFSYIGPHRYSLRFCTHDRRDVFVADAPVRLVRSQFLRAAAEEPFAIVLYCYMPDHVHLLVEGQTQTSDCKNFIARGKQYSGFYYKKEFRLRLWQRYGFERVLRDEEPTLVVARYILNNRVRAGLVSRVEDYPYVGSEVYTLSELLDAIQTFSPSQKY
jgi:putative transposase